MTILAAFDIRDGREIWRTERDDVPTWSTPTVYGRGEDAQIIVNGFKHIGAYEASTGKKVWWMSGGGDIPVPTPVVAHGLVFLSSAHGRQKPLYAIRVGANGNVFVAVDSVDMSSEFDDVSTRILYIGVRRPEPGRPSRR